MNEHTIKKQTIKSLLLEMAERSTFEQSLVFLRTWDELLWKLFYFTNIAIRYPHQFGFSPEEFDTEMMHSFLQAKGSEYLFPEPPDSVMIQKSFQQKKAETSDEGLETVSMKKLIAHTNITDSQLNAVIGGREMGLMAAHLGNTDIIVFLEYKHWNVQDAFQVYGIQEALFVALRLWREANPGGATYRALVEIVLIKGRTDLAIQLCKFAALKYCTQACGLKTETIEELKAHTNVTDTELNSEVEETDVQFLATQFNNLEDFPALLGLNPAEQQEVKYALHLNDIQTAAIHALRLWRKANPGAATYRALVEIVLRMGRDDLAACVCSLSQPKRGYAVSTDPAAVCGLRTVTIEELKAHTSVTDHKLDSQIQERDFLKLSVYFENVESYLVHLGLTPSQQTDIKDLAFRRGTQIAMSEALKLWREPNPFTATYRALVEVLLDLGKGQVAVEVCTYLNLNIIER